MKFYLIKTILLLCLFAFCALPAQTSYTIKVHFLYGSKPKHKYKATESKWFGGVHGGHVGVEVDSNKILNFLPSGKFHWVSKKSPRHSRFAIHNSKSFWAMFGSDSVKQATVVIPISLQQKLKFDSLSAAYFAQTPYDYAFIGTRCAAAAYDVLAQIGVVKKYSFRKNYRKLFYPKKLRKRLFKKAKKNKWTVIKKEGVKTRKWEGG